MIHQSATPNDHLRAMRWAVCSSPILEVHRSPAGTLWPTLDWFQQLWNSSEWSAEQIDLHLRDLQTDMPIGRYFESLVRVFFELHPDWELLHHNVVLFQEGNTLGECDLVIQSKVDGMIYHLELACKYYLGYPSQSDWGCWMGRNTRDTLELKWNKLEQQLGLLRTAPGVEWLQQQGITTYRTMAWLKGYVFVPSSEIIQPKLPRWHHPKLQVGCYMPLRVLRQMPDLPKQWLILPKSWWLVFPERSFAEIETYLLSANDLHDALLQQFKVFRHRGWLVAQVMESDGLAYELARWMVVDDRWPL